MSLTNDDLLAISQLLDVKLKAEIQPIKNEIHTLGNEVQNVRGSLGCLQDEMQDLRSSLNCLQDEMQVEMQVVHSSLNNLHTQIHQMKLFQENKIMPRLNTIESCYLSTFNRYKDSVEGYEALQADNEIMKKVIMEHSEKLQKLA